MYTEKKLLWTNEWGHTVNDPHLNCKAVYHHLVTGDPNCSHPV